MDSYVIHYKMRNEITYPSLFFDFATVVVYELINKITNIFTGMWLIIHNLTSQSAPEALKQWDAGKSMKRVDNSMSILITLCHVSEMTSSWLLWNYMMLRATEGPLGSLSDRCQRADDTYWIILTGFSYHTRIFSLKCDVNENYCTRSALKSHIICVYG